jgi:hypothetical protein
MGVGERPYQMNAIETCLTVMVVCVIMFCLIACMDDFE